MDPAFRSRNHCIHCRRFYILDPSTLFRAWTCRLCTIIITDRRRRSPYPTSVRQLQILKRKYDTLFDRHQFDILQYYFDVAVSQFLEQKGLHWSTLKQSMDPGEIRRHKSTFQRARIIVRLMAKYKVYADINVKPPQTPRV